MIRTAGGVSTAIIDCRTSITWGKAAKKRAFVLLIRPISTLDKALKKAAKLADVPLYLNGLE